MLILHFHSPFAVRHTYPSAAQTVTHADTRHRKWSCLPSRLTVKCMISNEVFSSYKGVAVKRMSTQLGVFELPDCLTDFTPSHSHRVEQWHGCLAPSISHNASCSSQPTASGKGWGVPSCRACQTHPQICPSREKMMSLKGRKVSKWLGVVVWRCKLQNLVRKGMFAPCDVWLGGILGGKLLFRVFCWQGYSEVM